MKVSDIFEKTGVLSTVVASMSCGFCFPFLASLGASLGIGFLSEFEAFFIVTAIPILAWFIIAMQIYVWIKHKKNIYLFFGLLGPITILILKHFFWIEEWRTEVYYLALASMLIYSVFTIVKPPIKACCATTTKSVSN
jgi:mercuric ion transport protein